MALQPQNLEAHLVMVFILLIFFQKQIIMPVIWKLEFSQGNLNKIMLFYIDVSKINRFLLLCEVAVGKE